MSLRSLFIFLYAVTIGGWGIMSAVGLRRGTMETIFSDQEFTLFAPLFYGVPTALSTVLFSSAGILALITGSLIRQRNIDRALCRFFTLFGLGLIWLAIDERLAVHERLDYVYGLPGDVLLVAYMLAGFGIIWAHRSALSRFRNLWGLLIPAAVVGLVSMGIDIFYNFPGIRIIFEDGAKLVCGATLLAFTMSALLQLAAQPD